MPKLASSSSSPPPTLIFYQRAKNKPQPLVYPRTCRKISRLSSSSSSSSRRRAKQPRRPSILCDDDTGSLWGAKRPRSSSVTPVRIRSWKPKSILDDDVLLRCCSSSSQIPIWGTAKRPRIAPGISSVSKRDWTNLGDGPAGLIAERLLADDVADYICFRAVCRPWRLSCTDPREHSILDARFHPRHWTIFGGSPDGRRGFVNISTGCVRHVSLPEIRGHDVFGPTTEGLLVLLHRTSHVVRLLNPFTRQSADFPPATAQHDALQPQALHVRKELLNVSGAGLADESTIAVLFGDINTVAVAKPGDAHWTVLCRGTRFLPALSFAGRFYCASTSEVIVVETSCADHPPRLAIVAKLARPISMMRNDSVHLMDIEGKLMLVDRESNGSRERRRFMVYSVDLDAKKMVPVHGFGGHAVFIGRERSMSVSPSVFSSVSADTIYLGFDCLLTGAMDYSPIHLMDGTSEPRYVAKDIHGLPIYRPQRVDELLSWCVSAHHHLAG